LQRAGLGQEIRGLRQERDSLCREVEEQRHEARLGVEAQKAKLLEEAKAEVGRDAAQLRRAYEEELRGLRREIAAAEEQRKAGNMALIKVELQLRNRERAIQELMAEALKRLQDQGIPHPMCLSCPGYAVMRAFLDALPPQPAESASPAPGHSSP
jgi:hypothetical protein